jgi:hypothetical protein
MGHTEPVSRFKLGTLELIWNVARRRCREGIQLVLFSTPISSLTSHLSDCSHLTSNHSPLTSHLSLLTSHMFCVICYVFCVCLFVCVVLFVVCFMLFVFCSITRTWRATINIYNSLIVKSNQTQSNQIKSYVKVWMSVHVCVLMYLMLVGYGNTTHNMKAI